MANLDNFITGNLKVSLGSYLNNVSLGAVPKSNSTMFVKYRIGGGKNSNLGVNVITSVDDVEFNVSGPISPTRLLLLSWKDKTKWKKLL